jgi:phosphoribosylformylglycinamidine (FGAM) synthase PurS component
MKANVIVRLKEAVHDPRGDHGNVLKQVGYGSVAAVARN